jgi:N-acetylneuraminic acid mutarotase
MRGIVISEKVALILVLVFLTASLVMAAKPISAAQVENSWKSMKPIPTARTGLGVAVVDEKIYAIGGFNGANGQWHFVNTNEVYDPKTDSWTTKRPMPTSRESFGIAVYQNKIYVIGGKTDFSDYSSVNEVYDPLTDTWEKKTSMPSARAYLDASVVDGKIYLIGGKMSPNYPWPDSDENYVYDPTTDSWTTKSQMPSVNQGYATAAIDGKIYIQGGGAFSNPIANNLVYDARNDTWSQGVPLPKKVYGAAGGLTTGALAPKRIYIVGGYVSEDTDLTQVYNLQRDIWTVGALMPTSRRGLAVAVVNDIIYAIGGCYGSTDLIISAANERYTPFGYGAPDPSYDGTSPVIGVVSPENKTYFTAGGGLNFTDIALDFMADEPVFSVYYVLDGGTPVEIFGNATIAELAVGVHNITVFGFDASGNMGTSETVCFTISAPEPFPVVPVATASSIAIILAGVGLLVYFKKRKH